jgi:hypothetical protein
MLWKTVSAYAASNDLAIYKPYCGAHRLVQITTSEGEPVSWTSNKAGEAYISLQAIVRQRKLAKVSTDELLNLATVASSFIM